MAYEDSNDVTYNSGTPRRPLPPNLVSDPYGVGATMPLLPEETGTPSLPDTLGATSTGGAPPVSGAQQPQSPLDMMLGNYRKSAQAYSDLERQGPQQFQPSIWRRIAGAGLGTLAGLPGRQGYGRYGYEVGHPTEARDVARSFVWGPQTKFNADYQRRLGGAKIDVESAQREYEMGRQEDQDELNRRKVELQERGNKLTTLKGPDGNMYPAYVDAQGNVTPFFFPEKVGQQALPEQIAGQLAQGKADPAQIAAQKLKQDEDHFYTTDEFRRWKTEQDNRTKLEVEAMRSKAAQSKAPQGMIQNAVYAAGGIKSIYQAQAAMDRLAAKHAMGSLPANWIENFVFAHGAVDPRFDDQTRQDIGEMQQYMDLAAGAMQRAHTGRGMREMYDDLKKKLGPGQDWNALRGAQKASLDILTDYATAPSQENIQRITSGQGVPQRPVAPTAPTTNYTPQNPPPGMEFRQSGARGPGFYRVAPKPNASAKQQTAPGQ